MDLITDLYVNHPLWVWLALGAILLTVEVSMGSTGWLLWMAAAAGVTGLATLLPIELGLGGELVLFAALTAASTLTARRYLPRKLADGPDINDRNEQLVGQTGEMVAKDRVLVDGAEWGAEADEALRAGAKVKIVKVLGGAKLLVKGV